MGISDLIAAFIRDELNACDGVLELRRGDLAERFGCVPSQINYVMSTRFSPEDGYIVESRRGEGGYIRITRVQLDRAALLASVIRSIGGSIEARSAEGIVRGLADAQAIDPVSARLLLAATGEQALRGVPVSMRGALRADLLRQMLLHLV